MAMNSNMAIIGYELGWIMLGHEITENLGKEIGQTVLD
jgi:hypothetical protein